ncbi:MAG: transporter [Candidatus Omnitrophica bacterium]|nr:transporter [Candidatus Omnitrophota bacterium]
MLRLILTVIILLACCNVDSYAHGEADQDEWDPVSAGTLTTWTAPLCAKGEIVIQPFFFYNRTRGSFDSEGKYRSLPKGDKQYQYQEQLFMQYGITDRLEIDAQAVYQENYIRQDGVSAHKNGFGDSYLFLRYCAIEEKGWLPHLTGLFQVKMPTGKYQHLNPDKLGTDSMGTGSWDPGLGFILTKKLKPFLFHADAVFSFPQKVMVDGVKTRYASYTNYDFGVEYFLPKGFNLMLEANGYTQGDTWQDGERTVSTAVNYLILSPGVGWSCDKVQFLLAYQRVVAGVNTDANDSVVLTGVYTF